MKRSKEEIERIVLDIQMLKQNDAVKKYLKYVADLKDAFSVGAFNSKTQEEAFKSIGVIKGLDIVINLDKVYKSEV